MRFVSKSHAALRVVQGGKEPAAIEERQFNARLRAEQAIDQPLKPLTPHEIETLRTVDR